MTQALAKKSKSATEVPEGRLSPVPGLRYGVLNDLLGYALRRAQNAIYLDFHKTTAAFEVTPQRFAALVLIAENPGLRQGLLAEALGLHRSGAMRLTDWLTEHGWAERHDDPNDARSWGLQLSASGKARFGKLEQAVRRHDDAIKALIADRAPALAADLARIAGGLA